MSLSIAPPAGQPIRTLRGLTSYACGHTGSCCRAGWPIPVEPVPLEVLRGAELRKTLPAPRSVPWVKAGILGQTTTNSCVFHAPSPGGGCAVESSLGSAALPYSCRQFPRLLLVDGRGWHMSLSAWCGTAAAMIVKGAAAQGTSSSDDFLSFDHIQADPRVHVEGLDAHDAWPPLLRPGVLAGLGAYGRWEARLLADFLGPVCAGEAPLPSMLASALCWTDVLRSWRQSDGALDVLAGRAWRHPDANRLLRPEALRTSSVQARVLTPLLARVPAAWRPPAWPAGLTDVDTAGEPVTRTQAEAALARYLATRLAGSWVAYQGKGLRSVAASLVYAFALAALAMDAFCDGIRQTPTLGRLTSAIRASDWLLLHLLDRDVLAHASSAHEAEPDAGPLLKVVAGATHLLDGLAWARVHA